MAKRRPDDGLTEAELTEVKTLEANVEREEAIAASSAPDSTGDPGEAIARLQEEIKALEARIFALQHPYQPYPKMVKGHTFQTRAEHEAAGPAFAD